MYIIFMYFVSILNFYNMITVSIHSIFRLVSAYEDKSLGLSENGEVFKYVANLTFPKFVDKVIAQGNSGYGIDEHWKPFNDHCNFCRIKYDVVGRVEQFNEYFDYILHESKLSHRIPNDISSFHLHPSGQHTISAVSDVGQEQKVVEYLSTLSNSQIMELYKMYKFDFIVFGYDPKEYL